MDKQTITKQYETLLDFRGEQFVYITSEWPKSRTIRRLYCKIDSQNRIASYRWYTGCLENFEIGKNAFLTEKEARNALAKIRNKAIREATRKLQKYTNLNPYSVLVEYID